MTTICCRSKPKSKTTQFSFSSIGAAFIVAMLFAPLVLAVELKPRNGSEAAELSGQLTLAGSDTMRPFVAELAQRFESLHPGVKIEVIGGGSQKGVDAVRAGKVDIGMVSRTLYERETDLRAYSIARDGVCLVVHRTNTIDRLTYDQVRQIFLGKLRRWQDLEGGPAAITVIGVEKGRSSMELFTHYFGLAFAEIRAAKVVGNNSARIREIIADPSAITLISIGEAERTAAAGVPIKLLAIDQAMPSSKSIRTGDYPISRPLTLVTRNTPQGLAKAFIAFALSSQVTEAIRRYDFVPYLD